MNSLIDRTVVIIGGSSGLGLATAQMALSEGASVIITGRSEARLESAIANLNGEVQAVALDSADEAGTQQMFESLERVDHIFVSAATLGGSPRLDADTAQMRPVLDTRIWGSVYAAKYGVPKMPGEGSITFCSGVSVMRPRPGAGIGSASCAAVEALSRSLAVEFAPIRFNTIMPGLIETPLTANFPGKEAFSKRVPARRVGQPEDISHAVLFLMQNSYVTGITLCVDGGFLLV